MTCNINAWKLEYPKCDKSRNILQKNLLWCKHNALNKLYWVTCKLCRVLNINIHDFSLFSDPTVLDELDLDEKTKSTLLTNIKRRLTPQAVKVRADVEVSCYAYDGIDAVKNSLLEGLKCSSEDVPIKVCYDQIIL